MKAKNARISMQGRRLAGGTAFGILAATSAAAGAQTAPQSNPALLARHGR